jgi:hypothetical protein
MRYAVQPGTNDCPDLASRRRNLLKNCAKAVSPGELKDVNLFTDIKVFIYSELNCDFLHVIFYM